MPRRTTHNATMPLGQHLDELRRRILFSMYGLVPILCVALYFGKPLLQIVIAPVEKALISSGQSPHLISTAPFETFNTYFKVSLIASVLIGAPWILYQLWLFIAPGLYDRERRFVYFLLPLSFVLTMAGVAFFYYVILPIILHFLITFQAGVGTSGPAAKPIPEGIVLPTLPVFNYDPTGAPEGSLYLNEELQQLRVVLKDGKVLSMPLTLGTGVRPDYRVSETVSMMLLLSLAFAVGFQMPVVVLVLGWARIVSIEFLTKNRKYALFFCSIVAALLTPADPFSMLLMMVPLYGLYELGILLLRWFPATRVAGGLPKRGEMAALPGPNVEGTDMEGAEGP